MSEHGTENPYLSLLNHPNLPSQIVGELTEVIFLATAEYKAAGIHEWGKRKGKPKLTFSEAILLVRFAKDRDLPISEVFSNGMVVNGKVTLWGAYTLALAMQRRIVEWITVKWTIEDESGEHTYDDFPEAELRDVPRDQWPDSLTCRVEAKIADRPDTAKARFSVWRARRANLWDKGDIWGAYEEELLYGKALSRLLKKHAPHALYGAEVYEDVRWDRAREAEVVPDQAPQQQTQEGARVVAALQQGREPVKVEDLVQTPQEGAEGEAEPVPVEVAGDAPDESQEMKENEF